MGSSLFCRDEFPGICVNRMPKINSEKVEEPQIIVKKRQKSMNAEAPLFLYATGLPRGNHVGPYKGI